jgi:hypothetical protein
MTRHGRGRIRAGLAFCAAIGLAASPSATTGLAAAQLNVRAFSAGLGTEYLSRTVIWSGDANASRFQASLVTARADFEFDNGIVFSLSAGLAPTDIAALTFNTLPVSLQYDGAPLTGFVFGAEAFVPVHRYSDFEISGTGRFVYSFGMEKTWPLEDFAVEGEAQGSTSWLEAAIGGRVSTLSVKRIIPFLEISLRWLHAGFEMTETLGDLGGTETKRVDDLAFSVALGADADLTDRLGLKVKAGLVPYSGGVDGLATVGLLYKF